MGAGMSAEEIQKLISGNTTETYLGDYGGHSPMLDLVNRLSQQLNQQTAESNLYRGGNGYGGSFESAAQKAARANGQPVPSATPYGGFGGYGSQNPVMTNGGGAPGGGGYPAPNPTPTPYPGPGGGTGYPAPTPTPTPYPPSGGGTKAPAPTPAPTPYPAPGGGTKAPAPPIGGGGMTISTGNKAVAPGASYGTSQSPYKAPGSADPAADIFKSLVAKGLNPDSMYPADSVNNAIAAGVPPAEIQKHYETMLSSVGPNFMNVQHGSLGLVNAQGFARGTMTSDQIKNAGGSYAAMPKSADAEARKKRLAEIAAFNGTPVPQTTGTPTKAAAPQAASNSVAYVPPGGGMNSMDEGGGYGNPGTGTFQGHPAPDTGGGTTVSGGGVNGNPGGGPPGPGGPPGGGPVTDWNGQGPYFDPSKGKNWGKLTNPPKGANPGDYWQLPDGTFQTMGYSGTYHSLDYNSKLGQYTYHGQGNVAASLHDMPVVNAPSDWENQNYGQLTPPKYPGGNMPTQVGATGVIGYDGNGDPIYNDNGMFEQGDNATGAGDVTPDAWSTSAPWRPEEPTGGVYGAFKDLASGKLTDYENAIGTSWRDMANNPVTPQDAEYEKLIAEYNKTPGKGIDEAYNAYNQMINSNGYSDAEKGAMEGSAVRGVTQGYQRNMDEIRRQAARTGNANSAYAAMSTQAGNYGGQLGETNRQNQIKFADEAERRKEAGASGMTNVASLANTKAQFGLGAQQNYANELQRRREAATKGMGDYATFGRGLQAQGISGMQGLLKDSEAAKNNTYAQIAALLGSKTGQYSSGASNTNQRGWQVSASV